MLLIQRFLNSLFFVRYWFITEWVGWVIKCMAGVRISAIASWRNNRPQKGTKNRMIFPTDDALSKILHLATMGITEKQAQYN